MATAAAIYGTREVPSARGQSASMIAIRSALIATIALALLAPGLFCLSAPLDADSLALAARRFADLDSAVRRDAIETLAFELALGWSVLFTALLWWRGGVIRVRLNPNPGQSA